MTKKILRNKEDVFFTTHSNGVNGSYKANDFNFDHFLKRPDKHLRVLLDYINNLYYKEDRVEHTKRLTHALLMEM